MDKVKGGTILAYEVDPEELQAKKASSKKNGKLYCTTCCALSKEKWQQKRRDVYTEKMFNRGYGGSASTAVPANGVPCGIGFACDSAVQQSSGEFLCRFDADDVMYPERIQLQIEALRALPREHQDRTLVGTGFVRMPKDATPRYTGWLNGMTDDQLTSQRFREVTLLHPTWMYHRRIWERVGGYTQDTAVGEDIVFFHKHLEADGLLLRVPRPLLRYRCHPGQRSWRLPRRAVQDAKVAAFQRQILVAEPWNRGFGVLGAGRDARDFVKALSDDARKLVTEFYEVDKNKWGKWISVAQADGSLWHMPIVPQQWLTTPFVVCVALERGFGVIEAIKRDAPAAREGVDYFHLVVMPVPNVVSPSPCQEFAAEGLPSAELGEKSEEALPSFLNALADGQLPSEDSPELACADVLDLLGAAREHFQRLPTLVEIQVPSDSALHVVGDLHGQYCELMTILSLCGLPRSGSNMFLFNGDFVDRGTRSVETMLALAAMAVAEPGTVPSFITQPDPQEEALLKYPRSVFDAFQDEVFSELPLATLVNGTAGSISVQRNPGVRLRDIAMLSRSEPCTELAQDLLWSDPINEDGRFPSQRGAGIYFGPDVTEENNNLLCCIRSHEVKHRGYEWQRGGRCLTVFSAANYVGRMGNLGAVCHIKPRAGGRVEEGDLSISTFQGAREEDAIRDRGVGTSGRIDLLLDIPPPASVKVQVQAGGQKPVVYRSPIPAKPSALSRSSTLPMARTNPQDQKSISPITELLKDRSVLKRAVVQCFKRVEEEDDAVDCEGLLQVCEALSKVLELPLAAFGDLQNNFLCFDFDGSGMLEVNEVYKVVKHQLRQYRKTLGGETAVVNMPFRTLTQAGFTVYKVKTEVEKLKLYPCDPHEISNLPLGPLTVLDLPIVDMPSTGMVKCFFDIVMNIPACPITNITKAMQDKSIASLPKPFGTARPTEAPIRFDLAILKQDNDKFCAVKIFNLKDKVKVDIARSMCYGKPYVVNWAGEVKTMKKCVHFIFEKLGGHQFRQHTLRTVEEGKPDVERTQAEWDYGFDFIWRKALDSPIYKWSPILVEKSLRNLCQDGVLAKVIEVWPLTLYDLDTRILKALGTLFNTLQEKAIGFHGIPGRGKSPVARTIAMALSRYWIAELGQTGKVIPSFRQASEFDFFRGQTGTLTRPDIFDDGTLSEQPFKKVKAFTDVGNIESMSKERWGAAKWVKGQARIYCVNDFDIKSEPALDQPLLDIQEGRHTYIAHNVFLEMLESAWYSREASESNVMAVLKRTHIFVNTATSLYIRPASENEHPVLRIPLGDKTDFLHMDSRMVYDYHRKGGKDLPSDFDKKVEWEADWVRKAMAGEKNLPSRPTILRRFSLFSNVASSSATPTYNSDETTSRLNAELSRNLTGEFPQHVRDPVPSTVPSVKLEHPSTPIRVKKESTQQGLAMQARRVADECAGLPIEIPDSPSPKPKPNCVHSIKQEPTVNSFATLATTPTGFTIDIDDTPEKDVKAEVGKPSAEDDDLVKELEMLIDEQEMNGGNADGGIMEDKEQENNMGDLDESMAHTENGDRKSVGSDMDVDE
eukprot:s206_g2.t1